MLKFLSDNLEGWENQVTSEIIILKIIIQVKSVTETFCFVFFFF